MINNGETINLTEQISPDITPTEKKNETKCCYDLYIL